MIFLCLSALADDRLRGTVRLVDLPSKQRRGKTDPRIVPDERPAECGVMQSSDVLSRLGCQPTQAALHGPFGKKLLHRGVRARDEAPPLFPDTFETIKRVGWPWNGLSMLQSIFPPKLKSFLQADFSHSCLSSQCLFLRDSRQGGGQHPGLRV